MKVMKKLFSVFLAVAMICAMGVSTAFAADTTYKYDVYQIFTGDVSGSTLSNVKWGKNATNNGTAVTVGSSVPDTVLNELKSVNSGTDEEKLAVIEKYWDSDSDAIKPAEEGTGETFTLTGLDAGYYLVKDTSGSLDGVTGTAYTSYVVKVTDGTLSIQRKSSAPTPEKKILDTDETDVNEASIGDTVTYQITGTVASNVADYETYYYKFTDTLSKGLTFDKVTSITVNGADVTKYFYKNCTTDTGAANTLTIAIGDLLRLKNVTGVGSITKDTKVVVKYTATLNQYAEVASENNPNVVKLIYSNDPNSSGSGENKDNPPPENPPSEPTPDNSSPTGESVEDKVTTYTTQLTIRKVDENGQALTGATFKLTGEGVNDVVVTTKATFTEDANGTYWKLTDGKYTQTDPNTTGIDTTKYDSTTIKYSKTTTTSVENATGSGSSSYVSATVDDSGELTFTGLGAGTYTLSETESPSGYNKISDVKFTISFTKAGDPSADPKGTFSVKVTSGNATISCDGNVLSTTIVDQPGSALPSTGGIGTTIFYTVGAILAVSAGILLVAKRRMKAEE